MPVPSFASLVLVHCITPAAVHCRELRAIPLDQPLPHLRPLLCNQNRVAKTVCYAVPRLGFDNTVCTWVPVATAHCTVVSLGLFHRVTGGFEWGTTVRRLPTTYHSKEFPPALARTGPIPSSAASVRLPTAAVRCERSCGVVGDNSEGTFFQVEDDDSLRATRTSELL